jgi:hypothetical protein
MYVTRVEMHYVELTHSYAQLQLPCSRTVVMKAEWGVFVYVWRANYHYPHVSVRRIDPLFVPMKPLEELLNPLLSCLHMADLTEGKTDG